MRRFRGEPVFKVHRLLYHSSLGSKVIKEKQGRRFEERVLGNCRPSREGARRKRGTRPALSRCLVYGLGFRVLGLGFIIHHMLFISIRCLLLRVHGSWFRVQDLVFRVWALGSESWVWGLGFEVWGLGFVAWNSWFVV